MYKSRFKYVQRVAWYKHPISVHGSAVQQRQGVLDFPHTNNEEAHESGEKYQEYHTECTESNEESLIERYDN